MKIQKPHIWSTYLSFWNDFVYFYTVFGASVLDPGQCALRDPRKFSWTKNLRRVKKVFISVKLTAHMKKHEKSKIVQFDPYTHHFGTIL